MVEVESSELSNRNFTTVLSGLKPDTEYILSPYAGTADGTRYTGTSKQTVRTGKESGKPDVDIELAAVSGITQTGAVLNAYYIVSGNMNPVSSAGFKYCEDGDSSWTQVTCSSVGTPLSYTLTGLDAGTAYCVTAWIMVDGYTFESRLSDTYSFKTLSDGELSIEVRVPNVTGITENGAGFSASYTVAGSAVPVSSAGFKYRKEGTSSWTPVTSPSAASPFSCTVSGLSSQTKYYVTSWVIHNGTTYESPSGNPVEFTTEPGEVPLPAGGWAELPIMKQMNNVVYATYYVTADGQADASPTKAGRVRNYTVCFDGSKRQPLWVAYPMHSWYDGGAGRNDDWKYGPYIDPDIQPNLSSSYVSSYSRGHNVASSDRQRTRAMNEQTFYYTNMSPQIQNEFNGGIWNKLEIKVQNWGFNCSDTLYVVTGAAFINPTKTAKDNSGNSIPVPTHFYKVLLSSKSGNTRKPISQLNASELRCVGFWLNHFGYGTKSNISTNEMRSVADIEALTGFTFFPMLSESAKSVKNSYKSSDWGM